MKARMGLVLLAIALSGPALAAPGLIAYQGRITDAEGNPVTSAITVTFTFWNSESAGTQLGGGFSDADTLTPDADGVYSTMIGDEPSPLVPASAFSGNSVWLNVNVDGEDLVPRRRVGSVAYALQSGNADTVDGAHKADLAPVSHTHDAIDIESGVLPPFLIPGNLTLTGSAFIYGEAIRAGIIAQAYIDAAIARDSEILPAVLAGDGPGSGLDADTLDGQQASAFAASSHAHSEYAANSHSHGPYTLYYSLDPAAWQPYDSSVEYSVSDTGFGVLSSGKAVAPLNLPQGAILTSWTVLFTKESGYPGDVTVTFSRYDYGSSDYTDLDQLDSSGIEGAGSKAGVFSAFRTIDNQNYGYCCKAYSSNWGIGKIRVRGVIIQYTLTVVP